MKARNSRVHRTTRFLPWLISATTLLGALACAGQLRYPLRDDTVRGARQPKNLSVALATLADERPQIEKDYVHREELMGEEAYQYTEDLSYGVRYLPDAMTDQLKKHLEFAGSFRRVERAEFDSDLSFDKLKKKIRALRGSVDLVMIGKISHFYGYDDGNLPPRSIDAHCQIKDIVFVSTRSLKPVFKTTVSIKVQEKESDRRGNQYDHALETMRLAFNDLVVKVSKGKIRKK